ncbi:MAG: hypothetical protein KatS3mg057_1759 [Herpetosiphonaceae bacterium]|nr:MAG: hypothetical protein KatS3mg057_1759 [Herpetosiphonaceae bacterium]
MKRIIIKNGAIIDPSRRTATVGDLIIEDGKVKEVSDLTMRSRAAGG